MNLLAADESRTALCTEAERTSTSPGVGLRIDSPLETLAVSILHDLRNPLATIHSGAEMLHGSQLPERQVRRLAGNMRAASLRIHELLQDYVELCRTKWSRWHPANLRALIADAVDRISGAAEAQSVIVVQDVPPDLVVTVDHSRIRSVLANLLANALDAMPTGGSIQISTLAAGTSVVVKLRIDLEMRQLDSVVR